ncbi:hypothetical protein BDN71DRAFT_1430623 [Pleurotus eryngii]|uniref:Uncharacterized protein n=1 Tax=Pleurotus eryngii TaxID=5323 RepID=A0A9P5ZXT1_PLEER|nr:hypothetical protein BDN71DRAFT_1430623 [Pleurotus eryngii]
MATPPKSIADSKRVTLHVGLGASSRLGQREPITGQPAPVNPSNDNDFLTKPNYIPIIRAVLSRLPAQTFPFSNLSLLCQICFIWVNGPRIPQGRTTGHGLSAITHYPPLVNNARLTHALRRGYRLCIQYREGDRLILVGQAVAWQGLGVDVTINNNDHEWLRLYDIPDSDSLTDWSP